MVNKRRDSASMVCKNPGGNPKMKANTDFVERRLYNLKAAAEYLGRPVWGVRTLIWNGKISYIQDGRKYYLDVKDLDAYIEREKRIII